MLTDEELVAICQAEIDDIESHGDLADERAKNLDFYHGDLTEHLPAAKDRSSVVTRDALDTVESVLPSLIRIFVDAENAVEFQPEGPDDEAQAKMETAVIRSIFFERNNGFLHLYTFIKDCLISNLGVLKTIWEDGKEEREEYDGLELIEAEKLLMEPDADPIEYEEADGKINLVLKRKIPGEVCIDTPAPEEFGISRNASSPNPKKAPFVFQKVEKTISDLIEMGFKRDVVEAIPSDDTNDEERQARRNRSDEYDYQDSSLHRSMRKVWVYECYVRVDDNDDGIAELLKVTLASHNSGHSLLEREEVDSVLFSTATPIILTHKFYGWSLIDLVRDIQTIRTTLFRGILDNMYLSNNVRMGANEKVNLDDLLVSRPGGIVRTEGDGPPLNHVQPIAHPPISPQTFGLLEVLDDMLKGRTGVGDEVAGLDSSALANINTGVIAQAYDAARMRIELMARIIAEIGLKPHFEDIRRVLYKKQSGMMRMKVNGQWVEFSPSSWRENRRTKVSVGLGYHTRDKKLMSITNVLALQEKAVSLGYQYITPENIHNAISDMIEAHGLSVDKYFQNPATYQPPEKGPSVESQIKQAELQLEREKLMVEREKVQLEGQIKVMMAQSKERELETKRQLEEMKGRMQINKIAIDEQNQVMRAQTEAQRMMFDVQMSKRQQDWKEKMDALDAQLKRHESNVEVWKSRLDSATEIETKLMDIEQRIMAEIAKHINIAIQSIKPAEQQETKQ